MVLALEPGRVWAVSEGTISMSWNSNDKIIIRGYRNTNAYKALMGKLARLPTSVTWNIGNVPDEAKEGSIQL